MLRAGARAEGRELEFIVRSLLELKLQVEDLRRRVDDTQEPPTPNPRSSILNPISTPALSAPGTTKEDNVVTVKPGTRMSDIEKQVIDAALRQTRGNRRKAAELLAIGERTLYRKLKEYEIGDGGLDLESDVEEEA
jgi:DNA-binding NtrC family response regulator